MRNQPHVSELALSILCAVLATAASTPSASAADRPAKFDGKWHTSVGIVTLKQSSNDNLRSQLSDT